MHRASPVLIATLLITTLFPQFTGAQEKFAEKENIALHPKAGVLYSRHSSDFSSFAGILDYCVQYENDAKINYSAFLAGEYPIYGQTHLGLGVGYINRSTMLSSKTSYPARDTNGVEYKKEYENVVDAKLSYLEIQPEIRSVLVEKLFSGPLRAVGALRFAIPVQAEFSQTDKAVSPSGLVFVNQDGSRVKERAIASGNISSKSALQFGLSAGIENLLRVGKNSFFSQQILFDYNFSNVVTDATWKPWAIRAEIGLRYSFTSEEEIPVRVITEKIPEKEPEKPVQKPVVESAPLPLLQYTIRDVKAVLQTGNELLSTAPIVNAVFFEQNSSEIPAEYSRQRITNENFFSMNGVTAHKYLLGRIADIISRNPKAKIILEGATSGNDESGLTLAKLRAEAVRNALTAAGVPEDVISLKTNILPKNSSNLEFPAGREENRRVDIIVQNAPLQEYVARQQFAQVRGTMRAEAKAENIDRAVVVANCTDTSFTINRSGDFSIPFLCRIDAEQKFLSVKSSASSDKTGKVEANYELDLARLPKEQISLLTENFSAILRFDYNSSELSQANKDLLRQLSEKIPSNAEIIISGSSDVTLGSEQRNIELSNARAKATEDFIRSVSGNRFRISASKGAAQFPDDTPEGRFLNRSITVRIKQ